MTFPILDVGGSSTNVVIILCGAIGALWAAIIALVRYISHLYQVRIDEKDERIVALEERDDERSETQKRSLTALEQSVAINAKQTDVLEKQIPMIVARLEEIKATATRRASSRQ